MSGRRREVEGHVKEQVGAACRNSPTLIMSARCSSSIRVMADLRIPLLLLLSSGRSPPQPPPAGATRARARETRTELAAATMERRKRTNGRESGDGEKRMDTHRSAPGGSGSRKQRADV
jgi:hypothetical protein